MKVTVGELRNSPLEFEADWQALANHVRLESSDLVLLSEMPFYPWIAGTRKVNRSDWKTSVEAHALRISRLEDVGSPTVISSRRIIRDAKHFNEGFVWEVDSGHRPAIRSTTCPMKKAFGKLHGTNEKQRSLMQSRQKPGKSWISYMH